jgi:hypothetical protein
MAGYAAKGRVRVMTLPQVRLILFPVLLFLSGSFAHAQSSGQPSEKTQQCLASRVAVEKHGLERFQNARDDREKATAAASLANVYFDEFHFCHTSPTDSDYDNARKWYATAFELGKRDNYVTFPLGQMMCEGKGGAQDKPHGIALIVASTNVGPTQFDYLQKIGVDTKTLRSKWAADIRALTDNINRQRAAEGAGHHMDKGTATALVAGFLVLAILLNQKPSDEMLHGSGYFAKKCQDDMAAVLIGSRKVSMFNGYPNSCW